jgi:hypothetical protein
MTTLSEAWIWPLEKLVDGYRDAGHTETDPFCAMARKRPADAQAVLSAWSDQALSPDEVARLSGVTPRTLKNWEADSEVRRDSGGRFGLVDVRLEIGQLLHRAGARTDRLLPVEEAASAPPARTSQRPAAVHDFDPFRAREAGQ